VHLTYNSGFRIGVVNANVPNMVAQISHHLGQAGLNILDLINKSRGEIAYTLLDVNQSVSDSIINEIAAIHGVIKVRRIQHIDGVKN
jgi:D-3-phosphoglycerate dehydrogenase